MEHVVVPGASQSLCCLQVGADPAFSAKCPNEPPLFSCAYITVFFPLNLLGAFRGLHQWQGKGAFAGVTHLCSTLPFYSW